MRTTHWWLRRINLGVPREFWPSIGAVILEESKCTPTRSGFLSVVSIVCAGTPRRVPPPPNPLHPPPQPIQHPLPSLPLFHVELNSTGLLGLSSISVPTGSAAAGVALSWNFANFFTNAVLSHPVHCKTWLVVRISSRRGRLVKTAQRQNWVHPQAICQRPYFADGKLEQKATPSTSVLVNSRRRNKKNTDLIRELKKLMIV